jgi:hydrogenase large subunit
LDTSAIDTTTIGAGRVEMHISPMGRVEGDLDLNLIVEDGHVVDSWTQAGMFRGFEIILKGKDPQAGLIVTPRICGICGGSHLYKSAQALDVAWKVHMPPNAHRVRNIAQACETLQSIPRWFYALFAADMTNKNYAKTAEYDEIVRRFAPFVGTGYERGVTLSGKPVEVYALYGGQWPHSSFMVPGGVMCAPTLSDVTRSIAILDFWKENWLESEWLGCSVDRWLENETWEDVQAWVEENESQRHSDCGLFIRYAQAIGLDKIGRGVGSFLATGTYMQPELYEHPTIEGRNAALQTRSGIYDDGEFYDFDQAQVAEDHTYAFFEGSGQLHPFDGRTEPVDPKEGAKQNKYTWSKAPRYNVPGKGYVPLEAGPLARQVVAGRPGAADHQDYDPLILDMVNTIGPSVFTRVLARMHEAPKLYKKVRQWIDEIDLHDSFYTKPVEHENGRGFGATEAARGALADWITLKDGKIENYQVITPTAWNVGPRDGHDNLGPIEQAFVGMDLTDMEDPIELAHVARSFDSCLVCTVHAYDAKTGKEMSRFKVGGGC